MALGKAVHSSKATGGKDTWQTPRELFDKLHAEFDFTLDGAADETNHLCDWWFGPGGIAEDALKVEWNKVAIEEAAWKRVAAHVANSTSQPISPTSDATDESETASTPGAATARANTHDSSKPLVEPTQPSKCAYWPKSGDTSSRHEDENGSDAPPSLITIDDARLIEACPSTGPTSNGKPASHTGVDVPIAAAETESSKTTTSPSVVTTAQAPSPETYSPPVSIAAAAKEPSTPKNGALPSSVRGSKSTSAPWEPLRVFLNCPYSQAAAFVRKARAEADAGNALVVLLLAARTDVQWFHELIWDRYDNRTRPRTELRFLKGRVKFEGVQTKSGDSESAPFPSMIVIFRPSVPFILPEAS